MTEAAPIARRFGFAGSDGSARWRHEAQLVAASAGNRRFSELGVHAALQQLVVFRTGQLQITCEDLILALDLR